VHTTHHLIGTTTVEHTADDFENRICNNRTNAQYRVHWFAQKY